MIANSIFVASLLVLVWAFYLLGELRFLAPKGAFLLRQYGTTVAWCAALVLGNLVAGILALNRKLFLKDTGRKLAHVEKQLRTGSSISDELSERISGGL